MLLDKVCNRLDFSNVCKIVRICKKWTLRTINVENLVACTLINIHWTLITTKIIFDMPTKQWYSATYSPQHKFKIILINTENAKNIICTTTEIYPLTIIFDFH